MVQQHVPPCKGPPRMRSYLPGGTTLTCIVTSSMLPRGQPDSRETCIVLQSGPTRSLVAKFFQRSIVACSMQISFCRGRTLRTRLRTDVYEPLITDVVAPKAHQNNHSYVSSADLPLDSLCKILGTWTVTRKTSKNHKTVKIGGWALAQTSALAQDNSVVCIHLVSSHVRYDQLAVL